MTKRAFFIAAAAMLAVSASVRGQERPFFITYDHHIEEPGNLELSMNPVFGRPKGGNRFVGAWLEFEYGTAGWWTTELYLTGQHTWREGTLYTGWRLENRFRLLGGDHRVNPVLYVEYENVNGADKALKEIVGFDGRDDQATPNAMARREKEREVELKAILGSDVGGWNVSENFIAVKNVHGEPWEFGYAIGAQRPVALAASPNVCRWCGENFLLGAELYGGLGDAKQLTLDGTAHYLAPVVSWAVDDAVTVRLSPAFGLTPTSHRFLLRLGFAYEFPWNGPALRGRTR